MSFSLYLCLGVVLKDKMDSIWCVTMATNLAELRHYYSHRHHVDRQNLVRSCDCMTQGLQKITNNNEHFVGW